MGVATARAGAQKSSECKCTRCAPSIFRDVKLSPLYALLQVLRCLIPVGTWSRFVRSLGRPQSRMS